MIDEGKQRGKYKVRKREMGKMGGKILIWEKKKRGDIFFFMYPLDDVEICPEFTYNLIDCTVYTVQCTVNLNLE